MAFLVSQMFLLILQKTPAVHVLCRLSLFPLFKLDQVRQLNEREGPQSVEPVAVSWGLSMFLDSYVFNRG